MAHFPTWWLIWLAVVVVLAIVRSVFVRKAIARREQERRERTVNRPARPARSGSYHVGAARQSPARASGQSARVSAGITCELDWGLWRGRYRR